ncbi:MAG: type VI secretion system baseplate subunit TssE [Phycisphaeraceae bacterium]|nr:type VI secretion system baseplate subunit TssE [Phycisphaeraceae bacterium]
MAELTPSERLQPSLLDRLTDDEPDKALESRDRRVMSMRQIRAAVLRDLGWLLNTASKTELLGLEGFPFAAKSVINYGRTDLTGLTASLQTKDELVRGIQRAIEVFEPRVLRMGLRVRLREKTDKDRRDVGNSIHIEISGQLWATPVPEPLYVRTEVDLESGDCKVTEAGRG